jgi:anti-anti-sigma regulatory factor
MQAVTFAAESGSPAALLRLVGLLDLDSSVPVRSALHKALADEPAAIVVDLAGLRVDDDVTLTVFTAFAQTAAGWPGCAVLLCAAGPELATALDRVGVTRVLPVYPDRPRALEAAARLPAPRRFDRPLPHAPGACAEARDAVRLTCRRWRVPHLVDNAEILVTELVANAVCHARGEVCLSIVLRGRHLHVSVRDGSVEPPRLGRGDPFGGEGGRGLQLIDAIADGWGSLPTGTGKWVWATLRIREP